MHFPIRGECTLLACSLCIVYGGQKQQQRAAGISSNKRAVHRAPNANAHFVYVSGLCVCICCVLSAEGTADGAEAACS